MAWNNDWKIGVDYPEWGNTEVYKKTIGGGYLYNGETPKKAYERVSQTVARRLGKPEMADIFFEYIKLWYVILYHACSRLDRPEEMTNACVIISLYIQSID